MKWLLGIIISSTIMVFPNDIAKINRLKSEAQKSYQSGDYKNALEHYEILIDSFKISEEEILMNYANAAFLMTHQDQKVTQGIEGPANTGTPPSEDQAQLYQSLAQNTYTGLAQTATPAFRSQAFNQLGVMAFQSAAPKPPKEVLKQAQGMFKSALIANSTNQQARFNFELVTKMLAQEEQNQDQEQQDQDQDQDQDQEQDQQQQEQQQQDQQQQDQQQQEQEQEQQQSGEDQNQEQQGEQENSEKQDGEPQESEQQPSDQEQGDEQQEQKELNASPDKMEELKISEEKARMILEAMKNSEVQYIQQNQKKSAKKSESGKPDW